MAQINMTKIVLGGIALLFVSFVVGVVESNWLAGVAILATPVAVVFVRLKLSPAYRQQCDTRLSTAMEKQHRQKNSAEQKGSP